MPLHPYQQAVADQLRGSKRTTEQQICDRLSELADANGWQVGAKGRRFGLRGSPDFQLPDGRTGDFGGVIARGGK